MGVYKISLDLISTTIRTSFHNEERLSAVSVYAEGYTAEEAVCNATITTSDMNGNEGPDVHLSELETADYERIAEKVKDKFSEQLCAAWKAYKERGEG